MYLGELEEVVLMVAAVLNREIYGTLRLSGL